eukprot:GHVO01021284.1.p1 GENE.GHVO01021284.1~~GHVO01021284.1.p1  ORF type:complete len:131 (+),score=11.34 GHVO01021284.1:271-663(+)
MRVSCLQVWDIEESSHFVQSEVFQTHLRQLASPQWCIGKGTSGLSKSLSMTFSWGTLDLHWSIRENGVIEDAAVFSDALDLEFVPKLTKAIIGARQDRMASILSECAERETSSTCRARLMDVAGSVLGVL